MPRMRTSKEVIAELRQQDQSTRFTPHALKILSLEGKIPFVQIGVKKLYNMDVIEAFLRGECVAPTPQPEPQSGKIRRIN